MAIYHLSVKSVSRSSGRSAVASSAYRAGETLLCERDVVLHDYSRRGGVDARFLIVPEAARGAAWLRDRSALWNAAEAAEKRSDAKVAREYEIALPWELGALERRQLAVSFAQAVVERWGVAADVAVHAPGREGDRRNWHAHVLTTTRTAGPEGLGAKTRALDVAATAGPAVEELRGVWEGLVNQALERAQAAERVDRRSLARQGAEREPTVHLGPGATAIERRAVRERAGGCPPDPGYAARRAAEAAEAGRWGGPLPPYPESQAAVLGSGREAEGRWAAWRLDAMPAATERGRANQAAEARNREAGLARQAMERAQAALEAARRAAEAMRERGAALAGRIGRAAAEARARLQAERDRHARAFLDLPAWERGRQVMEWFRGWAAEARRPALEGLGRRHAQEPALHEAVAEGFRRAQTPGRLWSGPAVAAAERLDGALEGRIRRAAGAAEREDLPAEARRVWAAIGASAGEPGVKDAYAAFERASAADPSGLGQEARQAAAGLLRIGRLRAGIPEPGHGPGRGRSRDRGPEPGF